MSEIEDPNRRGGKPLGRCKDRIKEYRRERGTGRGRGFEQAKRECQHRESLEGARHQRLQIDRLII